MNVAIKDLSLIEKLSSLSSKEQELFVAKSLSLGFEMHEKSAEIVERAKERAAKAPLPKQQARIKLAETVFKINDRIHGN